MARPTSPDRRGAFTLIELMAVIVVLSILAAVALPKFYNYQVRAREAACKGSLGNMRAGLSNFLADMAINSSGPAYPTYGQLPAPGLVMQEALPENPYNGKNTIRNLALGDANIRWTDSTTGWCYYVNNSLNPPRAVLWPNSNTVGENTF